MAATFWHILKIKHLQWPETEIKWIWWNFIWKIREITVGKSILAGFIWNHCAAAPPATTTAAPPCRPLPTRASQRSTCSKSWYLVVRLNPPRPGCSRTARPQIFQFPSKQMSAFSLRWKKWCLQSVKSAKEIEIKYDLNLRWRPRSSNSVIAVDHAILAGFGRGLVPREAVGSGSCHGWTGADLPQFEKFS